MIKDPVVSVFDIVMALSESIDLVSDALASHNKRVAYISLSLARELGFSVAEQSDIFIASALHDNGALTLHERLDLLEFEKDDSEKGIRNHCERGYRLLKVFEPFSKAAEFVRYHHSRWDTREDTGATSYGAHIIHLADRLAVSVDPNIDPLLQSKDIIDRISPLAGTYFNPEYVEALESLAKREYFWIDMTGKFIDSAMQNMARLESWTLSPDDLLSLTGVFAHIVDFRSHFTSTHSYGVASTAESLARLARFTKRECRQMKIAGFLHDLGKLYVPETILEKPAKLDKEEFAIMRRHTYYTFRVLEKLPGLETINEWGAFHHERMKGSGYPFHHKGEDMSLGSRIMAVADVSTALTEDRPYRKGMSPEEAHRIIHQMGESGSLDPDIVALHLQNFDYLNDIRKRSQSYADMAYKRLLSDKYQGKSIHANTDSNEMFKE